MNERLGLMMGLSLVLAFEKLGRPHLPAAPLSRGLRIFAVEGLEILGQVIGLMAVYFSVLWFWIPGGDPPKEPAVVYACAFSWVLGKIRGSSAGVFSAVFAVTADLLIRAPSFPTAGKLAAAFAMVAGVVFFQVLLAGLQERLALSDLPRPVAGLPAILLLASLLAIIAAGLEIFVP
jgi:hypothetical protein